MATTAEALRTDTRTRILDAALRTVSRYGLSRFTVEDVAREAALSRQTVYRYFDSKNALVMDLVYREEEAFLAGVRAAHAAYQDLEEATREATLFCLRAAREHPLLDRLLASEPDVLLPYLTTRGGGIIARGRELLEQLALEHPEVDPDVARRMADVLARAIVSYMITPAEDPPEVIATDIARIVSLALTAADRNQEVARA